MHFDERNVGDYKIFAGALEAPRGDGYIATDDNFQFLSRFNRPLIWRV